MFRHMWLQEGLEERFGQIQFIMLKDTEYYQVGTWGKWQQTASTKQQQHKDETEDPWTSDNTQGQNVVTLQKSVRGFHWCILI